MIHDSDNPLAPSVRRHGLFFDDIRVGEAWRTEGHSITQDAVIAFAAEWDRQPFHVDIEAARASIFGQIVGSGLQTVMLSYRLYHALGLLDGTAIAGLGIDAIRFKAPLVPGDTIHVVVRAGDCRPTSRRDRGIVVWHFETINQVDNILMTMTLSALVATRPVDGVADPQNSGR